jgi:hypothetical protein
VKLTRGEEDDGTIARFYRGESGSGPGSGDGITGNEEGGGGASGVDEKKGWAKGGKRDDNWRLLKVPGVAR